MLASVISNPGFYMTYAVIQAVIVLLLIRLLDVYRRQPLSMLALMALWGSTAAALLALIGNAALSSVLHGDAQRVFGDVISAPFVEEGAKGLALLAAVGPLSAISRRFGLRILAGFGDGVVFGAAVGLGFGFTEDFFYFLDRARTRGINDAVDVFLYRRDFFGPAVLHHALFTAAFGAGLGAASWSNRRSRRLVLPLVGFAVAVFLHAVNNGLLELVLTLKYGLHEAALWVQGLPVGARVDHTATVVADALRGLDYLYIAFFIVAMTLWVRYQRRLIDKELQEEVATGLLLENEWLLEGRWRDRVVQQLRLVRTGQFEQLRLASRVRAKAIDLALLKARRKTREDELRIQRLRREIATLATFDARPGRIPRPPNPLIGRERELADAASLLRRGDVRLVTLTGPGGIGKTRLAIALLEDLRDDFGGGAFFVPLAPLRDATLVPDALAEGLGIVEASGRSLEQVLHEYLRDKHMLLALDNLEHLPEAGPLIGRLVEAAPRVKVLVTSRSPLRIAAEVEYAVPPLSIPDLNGEAEDLGRLAAVALFVARARATVPDYAPTHADLFAVGEICRRLDGLPLAVELAAAWARSLSPHEIVERLDSRLDLLVGGRSDAPERQQTLRNTISWSYDLLPETERRIFRRLAIFSGSWSLEAAEVVCGLEEERLVLAAVGSLVEKSLVRIAGSLHGVSRYEMLETIAEFARGELGATAEAGAVRERHGNYFRELAERVEPRLFGPQQALWLDRLHADHNNLRRTLEWTLETGEIEAGLRLASSLLRFWSARGYLGEGRRWLSLLLARGGPAPSNIGASATFAAGYLALSQGDYRAAEPLFEESLALSEEGSDGHTSAATLAQLGWISMDRGDLDEAVQLCKKSLVLARTLEERQVEGTALNNLGATFFAQEDFARAQATFEESLKIRRAIADDRNVANSLVNLGRTHVRSGNPHRARGLLEEGLSLALEVGDSWTAASARINLGLMALADDDREVAEALLLEAMIACSARGDVRTGADALQGLAAVAAAAGQFEHAARLFGAARGALRAAGASSVAHSIYESYDRLAREGLGQEQYDRAAGEGSRMTPAEVVELARIDHVSGAG